MISDWMTIAYTIIGTLVIWVLGACWCISKLGEKDE